MTNLPREADELYQKLRAEPWIEPWLDEEELYPGQGFDRLNLPDWNAEKSIDIKPSRKYDICTR